MIHLNIQQEEGCREVKSWTIRIQLTKAKNILDAKPSYPRVPRRSVRDAERHRAILQSFTGSANVKSAAISERHLTRKRDEREKFKGKAEKGTVPFPDRYF